MSLFAPYFPLRSRSAPCAPSYTRGRQEIPPPPLHNMQIEELTSLGFLEITLFSSVTIRPARDLIPLTDMRVLGQKHNFSQTNFLHFFPSPVDDIHQRTQLPVPHGICGPLKVLRRGERSATNSATSATLVCSMQLDPLPILIPPMVIFLPKLTLHANPYLN